MSEGRKCVVAKCACCERVVYAHGGKLDASDRREIGEMVASGLHVSLISAEEVRAAPWGCEIKRQREAAEAEKIEAAKPENKQRAKYEAVMREMRGQSA